MPQFTHLHVRETLVDMYASEPSMSSFSLHWKYSYVADRFYLLSKELFMLNNDFDVPDRQHLRRNQS
ncbi:hypothetical protein OESDEN_07403 [Oesophagostomum dentatum]|uniref:Uncharacterized protein n=1 Tax=Oesophagostomum dentatum TaxID=61180 RepID=A0A0B1TBJ3_OESDE|nr:hypothetical protein OESDEN_07403 [Oesophagostomum dentatum]